MRKKRQLDCMSETFLYSVEFLYSERSLLKLINPDELNECLYLS